MILDHLKTIFTIFTINKINWQRLRAAAIFLLTFSILAVSMFTFIGIGFEPASASGIPANTVEGAVNSMGALAPLYSKLNRSDILCNSARSDIYNIIDANPGITLGAITRELNLKNGTATHHLYILEREGYIKSRKTGKFRRFYNIDYKPTGFNEIQDRILDKIRDQPGITQSGLARELNHSRQLINYHMNDLIENRVIKLEKRGNRANCYLKQ
jgi:DNA-binding MarR family transcriptional regulator